MTKERIIERELEIAAPVASVWKAITDADELQRWFPLEAKASVVEGGTISLLWGDKCQWHFKVDIAHQEKHLRLLYNHNRDIEWTSADDTDHTTMIEDADGELAVDYFLEADGGKTKLRLVHSGFGAGTDWDEEYDGTRRGWSSELQSLKHYVENHFGHDRQMAWVNVVTKQSREDAWNGLMGPEGLVRNGSIAHLIEEDNYQIQTAAGDTLRGVVRHLERPCDFRATVEGYNNALLRVQIEAIAKKTDVSIMLATYRTPAQKVGQFEERYNTLLRRLFSE